VSSDRTSSIKLSLIGETTPKFGPTEGENADEQNLVTLPTSVLWHSQRWFSKPTHKPIPTDSYIYR